MVFRKQPTFIQLSSWGLRTMLKQVLESELITFLVLSSLIHGVNLFTFISITMSECDADHSTVQKLPEVRLWDEHVTHRKHAQTA